MRGTIREPGLKGALRSVWRQVWRYFVTGAMVWVPLIITIWVSWFFIDKFAFGVERLIRQIVFFLKNLGYNHAAFAFLKDLEYRAGSGFLIAIALFLLTGVLARYLVGRKIIRTGERILEKIPLISKIYRAVQQIRDVLIGRRGAVFQKVCVVEFPKKGVYAVGFITSTERGIVQGAVDKDLVAIFLPTTPNPTSGFLLYLPPEEVRVLETPVEEAMKLIVSGGAYIPGKITELDALEEPEGGDAEEEAPRRREAGG